MKNRLRAIIVLLIILALVISAAACGTKEKTSGNTTVTAGSNNSGNESDSGDAGASGTGSAGNGTNGNSSNGGGSSSDANGTSDGNSNSSDSNSSSSSGNNTNATAVSSGIVPEGFTERDFDIGYSDYETITLSGSAANTSAKGVTVSGNKVTITAAGNYLLTGEFNGQIVVDVPGQDDKVQLILDNATITNDTSAAIYVLSADKVFFTTTANSVNTISTTGEFVQTDENDVDGAIFSKDDIVFNGTGTLTVTS
ncbi:MAG: carbohydrate-binding domain-containing protein, partial [Firmicutes bacterium]|nr:carbohydrate-binding domain-containing protein [Bacillota bacterium]